MNHSIGDGTTGRFVALGPYRGRNCCSIYRKSPPNTPSWSKFYVAWERWNRWLYVSPQLMRAVLEQGVRGCDDDCSRPRGRLAACVAGTTLPVIRNLEHLEQLRMEVNLAYDLAQDHEYGEEVIRCQSVLDALIEESRPSLVSTASIGGSRPFSPSDPNALVREGVAMEHCLQNDHWTLSACMALGSPTMWI